MTRITIGSLAATLVLSGGLTASQQRTLDKEEMRSSCQAEQQAISRKTGRSAADVRRGNDVLVDMDRELLLKERARVTRWRNASPVWDLRSCGIEVRQQQLDRAASGAPAPGQLTQQRKAAERTTDPMGGAPSNCVELNEAETGGFRNICDFPVYFNYCAYRPAPNTGAAAFNCEKGQFALSGIAAKGTQAGFTRNVEMSYWFDCPKPQTPRGSKFVVGRGIVSTCK